MSCEPPPRRRPCHNSPDSRSNEQAYVRKTDLYALQDLFPSPEKVCKQAPRRIYRLVQTIDDNNTRWFEVYVYRFSVRSNPKKIDPQQKRDLVGRFPLRYFHIVRFLLKIINDCIWHRVALEEEKKAKRVESNIADTYLTNADAHFLFHSNLLELALKQISEDPSARLPLLDAWALVQYWGKGPLINDTKWPKLKALKEFGDPLNFENLENRYNWTAWAQGEERRRAARMAVFSSRPFRDNSWVLQNLEEKTCKSWGVKLGPVDVSSGIEFGHWPLFVELTVQYARAPSEDVIKISQEEVDQWWMKGRRGTSRSTRNSTIVDINGDLIVDDDSEQSA